MQSYLKTKPIWIQILLFLGLAFGIWMVLTFLGLVVLTKVTGISLIQMADISKWDSNNPNMIIFIRGMLLIQFLGLFLTPSLLFAYFSDPRPMHYIGLKPPAKISYWFYAIASLLIAIPLVEYLGILNRQIVFGPGMQRWVQSLEEEAMKQIQFMLVRHEVSELILNLVFISLFAGVGEELFFRGVLQRLFIKAFKNPWAGIITAAMLFSAFHFQFFGFIPRLFLGILLGAVYWYSGSLWPSIAAHTAYDGFIIVLMYLKPELAKNAEASPFDQSSLAILALGSAVLVALMLWQMKKNTVTSYADVYKDDYSTPEDFTF
jgi:membrane protease YdiL (CAAX protease family)